MDTFAQIISVAALLLCAVQRTTVVSASSGQLASPPFRIEGPTPLPPEEPHTSATPTKPHPLSNEQSHKLYENAVAQLRTADQSQSHTVPHSQTASFTVPHSLSHTQTHPQFRIKSHTQSLPQSHTVTNTQSHISAHPQSHIVGHTVAHHQPHTESQTASHTHTQAHPQSHTIVHTVAHSNTQSQTSVHPQPHRVAHTESHSTTHQEAEPHAQSHSQSHTVAHPLSHIQSHPQSHTESHTVAHPHTDHAQSHLQSHPQSHTVAHTQSHRGADLQWTLVGRVPSSPAPFATTPRPPVPSARLRAPRPTKVPSPSLRHPSPNLITALSSSPSKTSGFPSKPSRDQHGSASQLAALRSPLALRLLQEAYAYSAAREAEDHQSPTRHHMVIPSPTHHRAVIPSPTHHHRVVIPSPEAARLLASAVNHNLLGDITNPPPSGQPTQINQEIQYHQPVNQPNPATFVTGPTQNHNNQGNQYHQPVNHSNPTSFVTEPTQNHNNHGIQYYQPVNYPNPTAVVTGPSDDQTNQGIQYHQPVIQHTPRPFVTRPNQAENNQYHPNNEQQYQQPLNQPSPTPRPPQESNYEPDVQDFHLEPDHNYVQLKDYPVISQNEIRNSQFQLAIPSYEEQKQQQQTRLPEQQLTRQGGRAFQPQNHFVQLKEETAKGQRFEDENDKKSGSKLQNGKGKESAEEEEDSRYEYQYHVAGAGGGRGGGGAEGDFGHEEARAGGRTWGRYHVALPDGRRKTVHYWADHTGYHAEVDYEGTATTHRQENLATAQGHRLNDD